MIQAKTQNIMLWDLHGPTVFFSKVSLAASEDCYIFSSPPPLFFFSYAFLSKSRRSFLVCIFLTFLLQSYIDFPCFRMINYLQI
jgi:hypothetical protein